MCDGNVPAWLVAVALGLFLAARLVIGSQRQSPRKGQVPAPDARGTPWRSSRTGTYAERSTTRSS